VIVRLTQSDSDIADSVEDADGSRGQSKPGYLRRDESSWFGDYDAVDRRCARRCYRAARSSV